MQLRRADARDLGSIEREPLRQPEDNPVRPARTAQNDCTSRACRREIELVTGGNRTGEIEIKHDERYIRTRRDLIDDRSTGRCLDQENAAKRIELTCHMHAAGQGLQARSPAHSRRPGDSHRTAKSTEVVADVHIIEGHGAANGAGRQPCIGPGDAARAGAGDRPGKRLEKDLSLRDEIADEGDSSATQGEITR